MTTDEKDAHWISRAENALNDAVFAKDHDIDVIFGKRSVALDTEMTQDLLAVLFAAFLCAAAIVRERSGQAAFNPFNVVLWACAIGFTARAVVGISRALRKIRSGLSGDTYAVVLMPEGALIREAGIHRVFERNDILAVIESKPWTDRSTDRTDVHVVVRPHLQPTHITLPPVFDLPQGALSERLMRWRGVIDQVPFQASADALASAVYDQAAKNEALPDVLRVRLGTQWRMRMPVGSLIFGAAIVVAARHQLPAFMSALGPAQSAIVVALVFVSPFFWWRRMRAELEPRRGLAMVFAPVGLLLRLRSGVLATPWSDVSSVHIDVEKRWSVLGGFRPERAIRFERQGASPIAYEEAFMNMPAEVVKAHADAYRARARLRDDSASMADDSASRASG